MSTTDSKFPKADCANCPLKDVQRCLAPQPAKSRSKLIVLGEEPRASEVTEQKHLVGRPGRLLNFALKEAGLSRGQCHLTNAVLCQPDRTLSPKEWAKAVKACRPRLLHELHAQTSRTILVCGARALQTTFGKSKINNWIGAPANGINGLEDFTLLPTMSPGAAVAKPALQPVFRRFVQRGIRFATQEFPSPWVYPQFRLDLGEAVQRFLRSVVTKKSPVGVDVETAGIDPVNDRLLCIGIATPEGGVSLDWDELRGGFERSGAGDGETEELRLVQQILAQNPLTMHNGQHDVLSLRANGLPCGNFDFDTLIAHAVVAPELPHDLGFVAAVEFPAPRWKTEFRVERDLKGASVFTEREPRDLRLYNAKDSYFTILLRHRLQEHLDRMVW